MLFLDGFEEVAVGAKTVLAGDGIFENNLAERHQGERHVGAEEGKEADARKVGSKVGKGRLVYDGGKGELGEDDGGKECEDVYRKDWFFTKPSIGVENEGNEKGESEEA